VLWEGLMPASITHWWKPAVTEVTLAFESLEYVNSLQIAGAIPDRDESRLNVLLPDPDRTLPG